MESNNTEKIGNVVLDYTYYPGEDLYSEGAAEDRLLDYVKTHTASEYEEFIQGSRSWSVVYHLSYIRENVASWLPITSKDKVLEVGSGCGAITGAFARIADKVTCVELSRKRSLINAYRNKEFDNLNIMVGNFEDIEPNLPDKYDYITLIGVYEYAASYIKGENPYNVFLQKLKKHLAPGGKIVIAIENRLGLKYFAGCKEDHLNEYFAGITGYDSADGVCTFSKRTLTRLLDEEELHYKFYYPYPDYKLPHTIYSDDFLPSKGDLNTNLRNFDTDRIVLFDEGKAFDTFIDEGLFPEYSNSFIVIASMDEDWDKKIIRPLFVKYANERMGKFRVNTMIAVRPDGEKIVFKRSLSNQANDHILRLCNNYNRLKEQYGNTGLVPAKVDFIKGVSKNEQLAGAVSSARDIAHFEFVSGMTLENYLNKLEDEERYAKMEELILEYCKKLESSGDTVKFKKSLGFSEVFGSRDFGKEYKATSPCNLDMIFSNIVFDKQRMEYGEWKVLDYEWVLEFPVPIPFVIYRAIYYHFREKENGGFANYLSKKGMDVYSLCGIDIGERMLFKEMEHSFQLYTIGGAASLDVIRRLMPAATMDVATLIKSASYLRNLDIPKIYFSRAKNFTEDNQITMIAKAENNRVSFKVPFDRYLSSIRVDPTEYPCFVYFENACFVMSDGAKQYVDSILINGYKVSDRVFLFDTNDPQMIMYDVPAGAKSLEMSYNVTIVDKVYYDELVKTMILREESAAKEKQKFAYRAKRKIGLIKEEILPAGLKRVMIPLQ